MHFAKRLCNFGLYGKAYSSVRKALAAAKVSANKDDDFDFRQYICGSRSVIANQYSNKSAW